MRTIILIKKSDAKKRVVIKTDLLHFDDGTEFTAMTVENSTDESCPFRTGCVYTIMDVKSFLSERSDYYGVMNTNIPGEGEISISVARTIKFVMADNSFTTAAYNPGDTITYPKNTDGYGWPSNKPTTMPDENVTVTEVTN